MQKITLLILSAFLFCVAEAQKNKLNTNPLLNTQLKEMLGWFEGEFDNFQQVYKEREDKVKEEHEHIHSIFKKVDLPAFGSDVFYVIQYFDGDTSKVYRLYERKSLQFH